MSRRHSLSMGALFAALAFAAGQTEEPPPRLPVAPDLAAPPGIRVWLADAPAEPVVSCEGGVLVRPLSDDGPRLVLRLGEQALRWTGTGILLGETLYAGEGLEIEPQGDAPLHLDGAPYPGTLRVVPAGGRLALIILTDLESYVKSVVPGEMPSRWPVEALKAQAVAARTYALYHHLIRSGAPWDLMSTVEDQLFGGGRIPDRARRAVEMTRGEVLVHDGRLFPAFFHSTCGGHTENPMSALGKPGFDFLEGVPCPYCRGSRHETWSARITAETLERRLRDAGYDVGRPITACVAQGPQEGSARSVRLEWPGGKVVIPAVEFRRAVGRMVVRSGRFRVIREDGAWLFRGRGLGHGAGMCQYGARGMAALGKSYRDILAYYYRNTELVRLY